MDSSEESESLDSAFFARATFACFELDSFLDNFDIAVLTRPARNSIDFLEESPFQKG
jgi:hypothetical protein